MLKVNLKTKKVTREVVPKFLGNLSQDSLNDLGWTDASLGLQGFGFWKEKDVTAPFDHELQTYDGTETYVVDSVNVVVDVTKGLRNLTETEKIANLSDADTHIQDMMEIEAQAKGYDSLISVCTYANPSSPTFKVDGDSFVAWRDAVWAHSYKVKSDVMAGTIPCPTLTELMAGMPTRI